MTENLSILGSTGSIGTQTLDVARKLNLKVSALTASSNVDLIEKQISSETIYDGKIIKVCKDTALLPNGNTAIREIVKHNGDVAGTLNDKNAMKNMGGSFNIEELRKAMKEQMNNSDSPETYQLKR